MLPGALDNSHTTSTSHPLRRVLPEMASRHMATSTAMLARAAVRQASGSAAPLAHMTIRASRMASSSSTRAQEQQAMQASGNDKSRRAPVMMTTTTTTSTPDLRATGLPLDHANSEPITSDLPSILEPAKYHPKTHRHHVATLKFTCYAKELEHENMGFYADFAVRAGYALGIPLSRPVGLPMTKRLWTVVRSPFVHKKSMENLERRTYQTIIKVWDADLEVVDKWLAFLRIHSIDGVMMRAEIFRQAPLSIGKQIFDASTANLRGAAGESAADASTVTRESDSTSAKIAQIAEQIVKEQLEGDDLKVSAKDDKKSKQKPVKEEQKSAKGKQKSPAT